MRNCSYHQTESGNAGVRRFLRFPWILVGLVAVTAVIALSVQHRNHVATWLPLGLVLLCPMMHLFHGGHSGDGQKAEGDKATADSVGVQRND